MNTTCALSLVDTHCHLTFPPLWEHIDQVLQRARLADIHHIVVPGYDMATCDKLLQISLAPGDYPGVHFAMGIHPWAATDHVDTSMLTRLIESSGAVAVGEIGLDSKIDIPHHRQMNAFVRQLDVARDMNLPVLLHCRGAFDHLLTILADRAPIRGTVHAFSRGIELGQRLIDCGLHLSVGGAITWENARRAHQTARHLPLDRLLLETDAPSMGCNGTPTGRTEPRHTREVACALATLRETTVVAIVRATTQNARHLFNLTQK